MNPQFAAVCSRRELPWTCHVRPTATNNGNAASHQFPAGGKLSPTENRPLPGAVGSLNCVLTSKASAHSSAQTAQSHRAPQPLRNALRPKQYITVNNGSVSPT